MKLATWNVNSLKVRLPHLLDWLAAQQPDCVCLQETKTEDGSFPRAAIEAAGYSVAFIGQKTYNGVALVTRRPVTEVVADIPGFEDHQKRVISATLDGVRVVCAYVPNGQTVDSEKYQYKLKWLAAFERWLAAELQKYPQLAVLGDYNIAPEDRDVHDPKRWIGQVLVSEPERAAFQRLAGLGFVDCFRRFEQPAKSFTWWDYRLNGFARNWGLRIDHILASGALASACRACTIDLVPRTRERPSDHAPVVAEFELDMNDPSIDTTIDHAVISVRDQMDRAAEIYRRLGFTLTPRGFHQTGSINHLMVFEHDYLELIGFPPGGEQLRPDLTTGPIGLDGLVLRSDDPHATYAALVARGGKPDAPSALSRPLEIDGASVTASFATVRFPRGAIEGGRLYFCQHLTPQYIWRPDWMRHRNGALGIERFTIVAEDVAREMARYRTLLGAMPPALELTTARDFALHYGPSAPSALDLTGGARAGYMAAVTIRVENLDRCAGALAAGGFTPQWVATGARTLIIAASEAMNCTLLFTADTTTRSRPEQH